MITTLIFDMDDTLYDEVDYCRSGFWAVDSYLSSIFQTDAGAVFEALWGQFCGGNHTKTFNAALDRLDIEYDETLIKDLIRVYREHEPDICLDEETSGVLDVLGQKYCLGLITDGFLPAQKLKIGALGLEKKFKCIVCTEELGREYWKPHPKGYELILSELGVGAGETAFIGDNAKKDFIGPNKLGIMAIQLKRERRVHLSEAESAEAGAKYVIESIIDLPELLQKL